MASNAPSSTRTSTRPAVPPNLKSRANGSASSGATNNGANGSAPADGKRKVEAAGAAGGKPAPAPVENDLDDALLQELETSLRYPARERGRAKAADIDEEMNKLLGEMSRDRR